MPVHGRSFFASETVTQVVELLGLHQEVHRFPDQDGEPVSSPASAALASR
jgi:hypothetical protein